MDESAINTLLNTTQPSSRIHGRATCLCPEILVFYLSIGEK